MPNRTVFFVSDGTGITAETFGNAILAQFDFVPGERYSEFRSGDRVAEYGIAAHALYKDNTGSPTEMLSRESSAYAWLRRTIELLAEGSNPEEFLEHTKLELFHDQVFCFTPKGKLIALPRLATAIDFAYAVHTDVGNHAVGCKINGKIAPLVSELNNGDEVEVLTSKAQIAPPVAWESIVLTGKARLAIRRATRNAVRAQYAELGRRIVERLCQQIGRLQLHLRCRSERRYHRVGNPGHLDHFRQPALGKLQPLGHPGQMPVIMGGQRRVDRFDGRAFLQVGSKKRHLHDHPLVNLADDDLVQPHCPIEGGGVVVAAYPTGQQQPGRVDVGMRRPGHKPGGLGVTSQVVVHLLGVVN